MWHWNRQEIQIEHISRRIWGGPGGVPRQLCCQNYMTIICFPVAISLRAGDEFCSRCSRNIEEQRWSQTFGPDCFRAIVVPKFADMISQGTRPCLDGPRPQEQHGSVLEDFWRNICSPQIYFLKRPWRQTFWCGYWAWTCQKPLIE